LKRATPRNLLRCSPRGELREIADSDLLLLKAGHPLHHHFEAIASKKLVLVSDLVASLGWHVRLFGAF
jgi:hypothetical protein